MSLAAQLTDLVDQVRALEAENAALRRENRRLRLQRNQQKAMATGSAPWVVLGVERGAGSAEVLAAFRKLSKDHHPDTPNGDRERFELLVAARDQMLSGIRP